jgi:hypothetical protein
MKTKREKFHDLMFQLGFQWDDCDEYQDINGKDRIDYVYTKHNHAIQVTTNVQGRMLCFELVDSKMVSTLFKTEEELLTNLFKIPYFYKLHHKAKKNKLKW